MDGISVYSEDTRTTLVPNEFIDYYMPRANGTFVKVYLYLLRCLTAPEAGFGISIIADALEETEKDILRALRYWERENVLSLTWGKDNEIRGIKLNRLTKPAVADTTGSLIPGRFPTSPETSVSFSAATSAAVSEKKVVPNKLPDYSPAQLDAFASRQDTNFLLLTIERYLERMLKPADVQLLFFLHDDLGFSNDLILHLYEYCVQRGKKNTAYIQKVAISWHEEGIDTVEKAEERSLQFDSCFAAVNRAFALNRAPGISERRFLTRWSTFGFSSDLIEEACSRTILKIHKPDFSYANTILEGWHERDVHTMSDVKKLDDAHTAKSGRGQAGDKLSFGNRFNSFPQRDYSDSDLTDLEKALLSKPASK